MHKFLTGSATVGAALIILFAGASQALATKPGSDGQHQVWVCKYVGKPGDFETLKPGKQPIIVDVASADYFVGADFADGQTHSIVIDLATAANTGQGERYTGEATCPTAPTPSLSPSPSPSVSPSPSASSTSAPSIEPSPTASPSPSTGSSPVPSPSAVTPAPSTRPSIPTTPSVAPSAPPVTRPSVTPPPTDTADQTVTDQSSVAIVEIGIGLVLLITGVFLMQERRR